MAAIQGPADAHLWWLSVSGDGAFAVVLTGLPADYRLYVYAPDGSLLGESSNSGLLDEEVEVAGAIPGDYGVFVDSPTGDVSAAPYTLMAAWRGAARAAPGAALTGSLPMGAAATRLPETPLDRATPIVELEAPAQGPTAVLPVATDPVDPGPTPTQSSLRPTPTAVATAPGVRLTPISLSATVTAAPQIPATCTTPGISLQKTAVQAEDLLGWEAWGFMPGTLVRAQAFANGTQAVSDVVVTTVNADCVGGTRSGDEVVVTQAVARAYYLLRVTGRRYDTNSPISLIARFSVSSVAR